MPVTHTGTGGTASVVRRPPTLTRTPRAPTLTATTRLRSPHPGAHADPVSSRGSFAGSPRGWAVRLPLTLRRSAMGWELPVARGPRVGCGRSTGGRTRVTVGPLASLQAGVGWGPGRVIQTRWDGDKDSGDDEHRAGSGPRPTLHGTPSRPAGSKTQRLLLRPWWPPVEGPTCAKLWEAPQPVPGLATPMPPWSRRPMRPRPCSAPRRRGNGHTWVPGPQELEDSKPGLF